MNHIFLRTSRTERRNAFSYLRSSLSPAVIAPGAVLWILLLFMDLSPCWEEQKNGNRNTRVEEIPDENKPGFATGFFGDIGSAVALRV